MEQPSNIRRVHLLPATLAAVTAVAISVVALQYTMPMAQEKTRTSAPEPEELSEEEVAAPLDENLGAPVVSYVSTTNKYAIKYPGTWTLDDSHMDIDGDILRDPSGNVMITITHVVDPRIMVWQYMEKTIRMIEENLSMDSSYAMTSFQRFSWLSWPAAFSEGERLIGDKIYVTRSYYIFRAEHRGILVVNMATAKGKEAENGPVLFRILESLDVCPQ